MKPIVIYLDRPDDEIKLTKKEFEEYINNAYDHGYDCGYAEGKKNDLWWKYGGNTINTMAPGGKITATNSMYSINNAVEKVTNTNGTVFEAVSKALNELGEEK